MSVVTDADLIWNRAALENGGETPACGDVALALLLTVHGFVANSGVSKVLRHALVSLKTVISGRQLNRTGKEWPKPRLM